MYSNTLIAVLIGLGVGAWSYAKIQRSTGGRTKSSIIAAAVVALLVIVLVLIVLGLIFKKSK